MSARIDLAGLEFVKRPIAADEVVRLNDGAYLREIERAQVKKINRLRRALAVIRRLPTNPYVVALFVSLAVLAASGFDWWMWRHFP